MTNNLGHTYNFSGPLVAGVCNLETFLDPDRSGRFYPRNMATQTPVSGESFLRTLKDSSPSIPYEKRINQKKKIETNVTKEEKMRRSLGQKSASACIKEGDRGIQQRTDTRIMDFLFDPSLRRTTKFS